MFLYSTPSISPEICSLFLILKQWNTCCSSEPYHCQQLWAYKHYKDTRYQGQDTVPNRSWIYKQFHSQINLRFMKIRKFRSSQEQRLSTRPEVAKFQITIQRHSTATVRIIRIVGIFLEQLVKITEITPRLHINPPFYLFVTRQNHLLLNRMTPIHSHFIHLWRTYYRCFKIERQTISWNSTVITPPYWQRVSCY